MGENNQKLEKRKLEEIAHSKKRREILQGFERISDTHAASQIENLEELIKDKEKFNYHFSNMKYYSVTGSSENYKNSWLKKECSKEKKILDFACGNGENGIYASSFGSECIGIDISPEGVENANKNAKKYNVDNRCKFIEMDGENMTFDDNTFDLGVEYGALHHVDLDLALSELSRVLKNKGKMMCIEAIRHNPIIHWYRKRTPHLRTEWEVDHILGVESFDIMKKYFENVNVKYFHLTSLILVPLRKTFIFPILLPLFNFFDRILLSNKIIGKYGWIMAIELSNPKK
jgi:ubiquinone/menaquinone biosynthesis C-methylase UbiE